MIAPATIFNAIINSLFVKIPSKPAGSLSASNFDQSQTISGKFWKYTEQNGKADISSFKGLL